MTIYAPWFDYWSHFPRIPLDRVFDAGGVNLQKPGSTQPGTIRLVRRFGNDRELVGFTVFVDGSDLKLGWEGVTLAPRGSVPIEFKGKQLKPWREDKSLEISYSETLEPLLASMQTDETTFQRLEGFFPVTSATGSFNLDRVRIFRIQGILEGDQDLAVIILTLLETGGIDARQDGGGSGPPKLP